MRRGLIALIFGLSIALAASPPSLARPCTLHLVASLPLHNDALFLNVPVVIDGRQARFIVDTGSEGSLIIPESAQALHLTLDRAHATVIQGPDGRARLAANVLVHRFALGLLPPRAWSFPLGALPGVPSLSPPIVGLMGTNLLEPFDIEFLAQQNRIRLWQTDSNDTHCTPAPMWPGTPRSLTTRVLYGNHHSKRLMVAFSLDGHPGWALVDSGARSCLLARRFANAMGISNHTLRSDPGGVASGVDLNARAYHWHKFRALNFTPHLSVAKSLIWHDPTLTVSDLHNSTDMLLGADWFRLHDVWISLQAGRVWVR